MTPDPTATPAPSEAELPFNLTPREVAEKIVAAARLGLVCLKPEYDTVDLGERLIGKLLAVTERGNVATLEAELAAVRDSFERSRLAGGEQHSKIRALESEERELVEAAAELCDVVDDCDQRVRLLAALPQAKP